MYLDMEWFNGISEDSMEVDIGYIPEMSLISSAISVPEDNERGANQKLSSLKWTSEISMEEAIDSLESHFFPFKKVYCLLCIFNFRFAQFQNIINYSLHTSVIAKYLTMFFFYFPLTDSLDFMYVVLLY